MPATIELDMSLSRVDASQPGFMTEAHIKFFQEAGFIIAENAVTMSQIEALRNDATAICRGTYGSYNGWVGPHEGQSDEEVLKQYLCLHFPHKMSDVIYQALAYPAMVETLTSVIGPNVKCMQSMLFIKAAGKPGQAWHQDELYIPTRDRSLTGGWIAMDDAHVKNGCLWVIPGSHKRGILWPQHRHNDRRFDCAGESINFPYTEKDEIPVEVKAGSIVFFNGYLLHRSLPNTMSEGYRRCLVNHYMSAESLLPWMEKKDETKPFAQRDHRDIVMIAGEDPYAYKGMDDVVAPHVRPSGEGGCYDGRERKKQEETEAKAVAGADAASDD